MTKSDRQYFAYVILVAVIIASTLAVQSRMADADMRIEMQRSAHAMTPRLRPLYRFSYGHSRRIKDTAEHRAEHPFSWVVDPGDGFLYSAWWE